MRVFRGTMWIRFLSLVICAMLLIGSLPAGAAVVETKATATGDDFYYLIGTMTGWAVDSSYRFTPNDSELNPGVDEYTLTVTLDAGAEVKAVKSANGTDKDAWYPDGNHNNIAIAEAGTYSFYLRPNGDGNNDWISEGTDSNKKVIYYTQVQAPDSTEPPTEAPELLIEPRFTYDGTASGTFYNGLTAVTVDLPGDITGSVRAMMVLADTDMTGAAIYDPDAAWIQPDYVESVVYNAEGQYTTVTIATPDRVTELLGANPDGSLGVKTICTTGNTVSEMLETVEDVCYPDETGPVIGSVVMPSGWSNDKITATVSVSDYAGVASVKYNGTDAVYDEVNGVYSMDLTEKKDYTVTAVDQLGNEAPSVTIQASTVNLDQTKPTITRVIDTEYPDSWVKTNTVDVKITASDDGGSLLDGTSFTLDGTAVTPKSSNPAEGTYVFAIAAGDHILKVCDNAGNESDALNISPKIDQTAPAASDVTAAFSSAVDAADRIWHVLSFGIYSNHDVKMTVTVSSTGSPIQSITVHKKGEDSETVNLSGDESAAEFTLDFEDPYAAFIGVTFDITDAAGNTTEGISLADVGIIVDETNLAQQAFEVIVSNSTLVAAVSLDHDGITKYTVGETTCYSSGTLELTATESVTGLDSVKIWFAPKGQFIDILKPGSGLEPITSVTQISQSGKVTEASYNVPFDTSYNGKYVLYYEITNNALNTTCGSVIYDIDNTAPVIGTPDFSDDWTNGSIEVGISVTDLPEAVNSGVASVTVKDGEDHSVAVTDNANGTYTFTMTERQSYTIFAADHLGNQAVAVTIEAEDVPIDKDQPEITDVSYDGQNYADIEVIVTAEDDLSDVSVYVVNNNDNTDVISAIPDGDGFKLTITADGENTYTVYARDEAGNLSSGTEITTSIDRQTMNVASITFSDYKSLKEHGAYANDSQMKLTLALEKNLVGAVDLADLASASYTYGEQTVPALSVDAEEQKATFSFTFGSEEEQTISIDQLFDVEFTFTNTYGYTLTGKLGDLMGNGDVYVDADSSVIAQKALFEVIVSKVSSQITIASAANNSVNRTIGENTVTVNNGKGITFTATISDELCGIDIDKIFAYFGTKEAFDLYGIGGENGLSSVIPAMTATTVQGSTKVKEVELEFVPQEAELALGELSTGTYVFYVVEENLCGNSAVSSFLIYVDTDLPVISNVTLTQNNIAFTNESWTNEPITVTYTVGDQPTPYYSGVATITVTGSGNDADYSPDDISADQSIYSFSADYHQSYEIEATDAFGNTSITYVVSDLRYDADEPNISAFRYGDDEKDEISQIDWTDGSIKVSFDVDDFATGVSAAAGTLLSDIASVVIVKGSVDGMSDDQLKGNTKNDATVSDYQLTDNGDGTYTCSFMAGEYAQYTAIVIDNAGNVSTATTSTMKVDAHTPAITSVKFEKAETTGEKILRYLSFGLYSNDDIKMTVTVSDAAPSSGIDAITAKIGDTELGMIGTPAYLDAVEDPDDATDAYIETVTFLIPNGTTIMADSMVEISVRDTVDHSFAKKINELRADGQTLYFDDQTGDFTPIDNTDPAADFEIISTPDEASAEGAKEQQENLVNVVDDISISFTNANYGYVLSPVDGTTPVYSGEIDGTEDAVFESVITDESVGIYDGSVTVYFDEADVTENTVIGYTMDGDKIIKAEVAYHTGVLADGAYTIRIEAENNAGNRIVREATVYVDNTAPEITNVSFDNSKWQNDPITVTFDVSDRPDGEGMFAGGIASITVTGDINGKDYSPVSFDAVSGTCSFSADYHQTYTIKATDVFGREVTYVIDTALNYDADKPNIGAFLYGDNKAEDIKDAAWCKFWVDGNKRYGGMPITLTLNDFSTGVSGEENTLLSDIKKVVIIKGSVEGMTDEELKETKKTVDSLMKKNDDGSWSCSFTAREYAQYTAIVTDKAGNVRAATTSTVKVDASAPVITSVKFEKAETAGEKILRFLTFGLYSNDDIKMTVTVSDAAPSSGIDAITAKIGDTELAMIGTPAYRIAAADPDAASPDEATPDEAADVFVETVTFLIPNGTTITADSTVEISVSDTAGLSSARKINELRADGQTLYYDYSDADDFTPIDNTDPASDFEIINTPDPASVAGAKEQQENKVNVINDISISFTNANYGYVVSPVDSTTLVYSGKIDGEDDAVFESVITDELVGIYDGSVTVYFDETDVTETTLIEYTKDGDKITKAEIAYHTGFLSDGAHTIRIEAENNAGNRIEPREATVYVDNTAPKIDNVIFDNPEWQNDVITVTYSVSDRPDGEGMFVGGIASITVTGSGNDANHKDYSPVTVDAISGTYSFDADYHQTYTITATDVFGRQDTYVISSALLYDVDKPNTSAFRYGANEAEDINNAAWHNEEDGMTVSFTVNDFSTGGSDAVGTLLSDIKSVYVIKGGVGSMTDEQLKAITENDESVHYLSRTQTADGSWICSFTALEYAQYTAIVTDNAGNVSTATTATMKIDSEAPSVTGIRFEKVETTGEKILRFLTFGLYHNDDIKMYVTVKDGKPSSGIADVTLAYTGENYTFTREGEFTAAKTNPDEATADHEDTVVFTLTKNEYGILLAGQMTLTVTDTVGHQNAPQGQTVSSLYEKMTSHDKANGDDDFEIVASSGKPVISDINLTGEFDYVDVVNETERHWFNGSNVRAGFSVSEEISKLHSVSVEMNDVNVTDKVTSAYYQSGGREVIYYTDGKNGEDVVTGDDRKVTNDTYQFDSDDLGQVPVRTISGENPANTIRVTAVGNNGNSAEKVITYYIDDAAPIITSITFSGDSVETYNVDDGIAVRDDDLDPGKSFGYYFRETTTVSVTASDLLTADGKTVIGSGIKEIHFIAIDFTYGEVINTSVLNTAVNSADFTADFVVDADFRGMIYAYAVDKVDNEGSRYTPNNSIVESIDEHNDGSSTDISIADATRTFTGRQDNNGHDLYNGDVYVTLTVADRYSGIGRIHYTVSNDNGVIDDATAVFNHDKSIDDNDPNAVWTYDSADTLNNIVKKATKTIRLDGAERHNFNNIRIYIEAADRVGYEIASSEMIISIDTTAPAIELTFDNDDGNTYDEAENKRYFKEHRVATIRVTERNFDPADFESLSQILNYEGPELSFIGESNWSTSYSDYTDASVHIATVTFAEDGDYKLELRYTDEAGNEAEPVDSEEFVIDNIDPVITVSYDNDSAQNGNYYSAARTATVVVTEHNFAEGEAYIRYILTATEGDNITPRSTPELIVTGWTDEGNDEHSATIVFDEDGQYEFTIDYTDKALREAEQFRQEKFYIDLTDGEITFSGVSDMSAYGSQTVAPVITFTDNNIDNEKSVYELIRISYNFTTGQNDNQQADMDSYTETEEKIKIVSIEDFEEIELNDGIYRLNATVTDLAGRTHSESIMFSVNRFGSTYISEDQATVDLIATGYSNNAPAVRISEINVTEPKNNTVSLTLDASTKEMVLNTDYSCARNGSSQNWYRLDYVILAKNFESEGKYTLTLSSDVVYTDQSLNMLLTNRTAKTEQRNFPISFVVDKTLPSISIAGVEDNTPYSEAEKTVKIICLDSNIDAGSLYVKINDELLSPDQYTVTDDLVGEVDIDLLINADLGQKTYNLTVGVKDLAGNEGEGKVVDFTLSASFFTLFFHNTLAVVLTAVGLVLIIGLAVFLVLRKRKNIA